MRKHAKSHVSKVSTSTVLATNPLPVNTADNSAQSVITSPKLYTSAQQTGSESLLAVRRIHLN